MDVKQILFILFLNPQVPAIMFKNFKSETFFSLTILFILFFLKFQWFCVLIFHQLKAFYTGRFDTQHFWGSGN